MFARIKYLISVMKRYSVLCCPLFFFPRSCVWFYILLFPSYFDTRISEGEKSISSQHACWDVKRHSAQIAPLCVFLCKVLASICAPTWLIQTTSYQLSSSLLQHSSEKQSKWKLHYSNKVLQSIIDLITQNLGFWKRILLLFLSIFFKLILYF